MNRKKILRRISRNNKQSMSQHNPAKKAKSKDVDENILLMRQAILNPSTETLTPDILLSLQSQFGNHFASQLVDESQKSRGQRSSLPKNMQRRKAYANHVVQRRAVPALLNSDEKKDDEKDKKKPKTKEEYRKYQDWDVNRLGHKKGSKADKAKAVLEARKSEKKISKTINKVREIFSLVFDLVKTAASAAKEAALAEILEQLPNLISQLVDVFSTISDALGAVVPIVGSAVGLISNTVFIIKNLIDSITRGKQSYALHKASSANNGIEQASSKEKDEFKAAGGHVAAAKGSDDDQKADAEKVQATAKYAFGKVFRSFISKVINVFSYTGNFISNLVTLVSDVVAIIGGVPSLGIAAAAAEIVALGSRGTGALFSLMRLAPGAGRKLKGVYKISMNKRGKNRTANAKQLVGLAYKGNTAAQQLLIDMGMFTSDTPVFKQLGKFTGKGKLHLDNALNKTVSKGAAKFGMSDMSAESAAKVLSGDEMKQYLKPIGKVEDVPQQLIIIESLGLRVGFEQTLAGKLKSS